MRRLHKIGKFYTRVLINNIGIFIFVGLLFVLFHENGWFPNKDIYAISQLVYKVILPVLIAYEGGCAAGGNEGGIQAVIAVSGILVMRPEIGILGGIFAGPLSGYLWKWEEKTVQRYVESRFQMLVKNLCLAVMGAFLAVAGMYLALPLLSGAVSIIRTGVDCLVKRRMLALVSVLIEPAKVFFLNNLMNYGILIPLGLDQVQECGSSVFFLLESNPGPGMGVLAALYCMKKQRRNEYLPALVAEALGGIHEVYFPYILSNLRLLIPLVVGGMAGNYCFLLLDAGVKGAVSPGSVLTILLMAGKSSGLSVLAGVGISAVTAFGGSILILKMEKRKEEKEKNMAKAEVSQEEQARIERVAFVCDGGMGSSAMGAALFRRMLAAGKIENVRVEAFAADLIPDGIDMIVCQKNFRKMLPERVDMKKVYTVENLVSTEEYGALIDIIQKRNE